MKGKHQFSKAEVEEIEHLISKKVIASSSEQKSIRRQIRKLGFYASDFGLGGGYSVNDFRSVVVISDKSHSTEPKAYKAKISKTKHEDKLHNDFKFKLFNPQNDNISEIPDEAGNYIICLKEKSKLPTTELNFKTLRHQGKEVIYVGISGKSLRKRDYKKHFKGNAGNSTFRKSLGSLFDYKKIPRSNNKDDGKTKFSVTDELKLSQWMRNNLMLYYLVNPAPVELENFLILKFNPPLNLAKNKNSINKEFRTYLSGLRNS